MSGKIGVRCRKMQMILRYLLHQQLPRRRRRYRNRHVRFAPGQVEHPRQGHDLYFQIRMGLSDLRTDLRQQEVRAAIRRADPDQTAERIGRRSNPRHRQPHCLFSRFRPLQQLRTGVGQRVALRRFHKQDRLQPRLQPGHPPAQRGRIKLEHLARARQALFARDGQKQPQIIPILHGIPV